jgi:uncharacterized protein (TIGR03083 family)
VRIERHVDCGELYEQQRRAFLDRLRAAPERSLVRPVPATPGWSVLDVTAHLVGICADLNAQRFGSGGGDEWTALQVQSRRGRTLEELGAEWDHEAPTFEDGLRLFGYDMGSHYLGDLLQHVADVHAALGLESLPIDLPLTVALDFYLGSFDDTLQEAGAGAVLVRLPEVDWVVGPGPVVASVECDPFEMFRSLGGRRSEAQIRSLAWTGDVDRVLPLVSRYPMPAAAVVDPPAPTGS